MNAIVLFWVTSPTNNSILNSGPHPTTNVTTVGPDGNQVASAHAAGRFIPGSPGGPHRHSSSALVLSSAPRSPITPNTPNLREKTYDPGFLSPSSWKTRFSTSLSSLAKNNPEADIRDGQVMEMTSGSNASLPRREVWDDRPRSFVMVGDIEANHSGPGYVTIGVPPPSKKRSTGRGRATSGGEMSSQHSGSRSSILGRMFGSSDARDRDMEVTVTVTTQHDVEEYEAGPRRSIDEMSAAGGSAILKPDGIDGSTTLESLQSLQSLHSAQPQAHP